MTFKRGVLLLWVALSGCALPHMRTPVDALNDPQLVAALNDLLCRVEPRCGELRLLVLDRQLEQAEMFPDGRLMVNLGLLLATRNEAEVAFILAHESAHWRLRHRWGSTPQARTRDEREADAEATQALRAAGLDPAAGRLLLQRLLQQAVALREADPTEPPASATGRSDDGDEALAQIEARVAALIDVAPLPRQGQPDAPAEAGWPRLLEPYQIRDDAPPSPPLQTSPSDP